MKLTVTAAVTGCACAVAAALSCATAYADDTIAAARTEAYTVTLSSEGSGCGNASKPPLPSRARRALLKWWTGDAIPGCWWTEQNEVRAAFGDMTADEDFFRLPLSTFTTAEVTQITAR